VRLTIRLSLVALAATTAAAVTSSVAAQAIPGADRLRSENDSLRRVIDSLRALLGERPGLRIPARPTARHPGEILVSYDPSTNHTHVSLGRLPVGRFHLEAT
jgi:hypothetical protein